MQHSFTKTGGAQIGWVNASWPLARLGATSDRLTIEVSLLGSYTFTPEQVSAVERYVLIPVLAWGVRIRHRAPNCPERIIFWSLGDPDSVLRGIRDTGFVPAALVSISPVRRGIPVRWSAIIGAIIVWNALFTLLFIGGGHRGPTPNWLMVVPLFAAFGLSVATLISPSLQRLIMKPD